MNKIKKIVRKLDDKESKKYYDKINYIDEKNGDQLFICRKFHEYESGYKGEYRRYRRGKKRCRFCGLILKAA